MGLPLSSISLNPLLLFLLESSILRLHLDLNLLVQYLGNLQLHIVSNRLVERIVFLLQLIILQSLHSCIKASLNESLELGGVLLKLFLGEHVGALVLQVLLVHELILKHFHVVVDLNIC